MLSKILKNKKIIKAEEEKQQLENEIKNVSSEILKNNAFLKCKNGIIFSKENEKLQVANEINEKKIKERWKTIESSIKKYREENLELKKDMSTVNKIFKNNSFTNYYLIDLDRILIDEKFSEIIEKLQAKKINYIQELNEEIIDELDEKDTLKNELKKIYNDFLNGKMSWALKTYLYNGDRLNKVYAKQRKIINIFTDMGISFIGELTEKHFDELKKLDCTYAAIENAKQMYDDYNANYLREIKKEEVE